MAKSGCPVFGHRQVNSGICMRIAKSRPARGLGKVSSVFAAFCVPEEPRFLSFFRALEDVRDLGIGGRALAGKIAF